MSIGRPHNVEALAALQPIPVEIGSLDRLGQLVLVQGKLVAIVVRGDNPYRAKPGRWFLEAGLGNLTRCLAPTFATLETAA